MPRMPRVIPVEDPTAIFPTFRQVNLGVHLVAIDEDLHLTSLLLVGGEWSEKIWRPCKNVWNDHSKIRILPTKLEIKHDLIWFHQYIYIYIYISINMWYPLPNPPYLLSLLRRPASQGRAHGDRFTLKRGCFLRQTPKQTWRWRIVSRANDMYIYIQI